MSSQADYDKVKAHLLDIMSAAQKVFDSPHQSKNPAQQAAVAKLKSEYVKAAVMLKSMNSSSKIPALLNPQHGALLQFNEGLSVELGEE